MTLFFLNSAQPLVNETLVKVKPSPGSVSPHGTQLLNEHYIKSKQGDNKRFFFSFSAVHTNMNESLQGNHSN